MLDINKRIAVSYSNPFLTEFYEGVVPLKVNAYSCDTFSQRAVVKALCGEIPFVGKSPVKLNPEELKYYLGTLCMFCMMSPIFNLLKF